MGREADAKLILLRIYYVIVIVTQKDNDSPNHFNVCIFVDNSSGVLQMASFTSPVLWTCSKGSEIGALVMRPLKIQIPFAATGFHFRASSSHLRHWEDSPTRSLICREFRRMATASSRGQGAALERLQQTGWWCQIWASNGHPRWRLVLGQRGAPTLSRITAHLSTVQSINI